MKRVMLVYLFVFVNMSLLGVNPPKIPKSILGYGYITSGAPPGAVTVFGPVGDILEPHGYEWDNNAGSPGNDLVDFMNETNGGYGFLVIAAHGHKDGWIQIEDLGTTSEQVARARRTTLQNRYDATNSEITYSRNKKTGIYSIVISPSFLQSRTGLPNSIVFLDVCYSSQFVGSLGGAGSCFGWNDTTQGYDAMHGPINIFYRTGGRDFYNVVEQKGDLRNKTVGEAMSEYPNPRLVMAGNSDMKLYNSPRIAGVLIKQPTKEEEKVIYRYNFDENGEISKKYPYEWNYPGTTGEEMKKAASIGDEEIKVKILFSSFMDEEIEVKVKSEDESEEYIVSGEWKEGEKFERDVWEGSFTIDSWPIPAEDDETPVPKAVLVVDAKDDFEGDINEKLDTEGDGNSNKDEKDTNHEFKVTNLSQVEQQCAEKEDGSLQNFALSNFSNLAGFSGGKTCFLEPRADKMPIDINKFYFTFSKPMDEDITNSGVETDPSFEYSVSWEDEEQINLELSEELDYCENYTITLKDALKDTSGVKLDGNEDGTEGGNYEFKFSTEPPDVALYLNPFVANVEEGHPLHPKLYTNGVELKKEVDCDVDFEVHHAGGWTVTKPGELSFSLPPGEIRDDDFTIRNNGSAFPLMITPKIPFKCDEIFSMGFYWSAQTHRSDHPDENQSPGKMEYPTPWLVRSQTSPAKTQKLRGVSPPQGLPNIGILLSGWADGYGHILGRYGIETLPVKPDLKILNQPDINISDSVKLLVIGSAGLKGFNSPTFETDLENYVVNGGNLLVFTQKYGSDLSVLPGNIDGYGWNEDQSCYHNAAYLNRWHPVLSGQKRHIMSCYVDGYILEYPDNSEVLLGRTKNTMPALLYYNYGAGTVIVSSLYSDWGYGHCQASSKELNLLRDLTTWAVNPDREIPEFYYNSPVSVPVSIEYNTNDTVTATSAIIKVYTPDRELYDSLSVSVFLNPGGETELVWDGSLLPEELGLWIIDYALMDDNDEWIQGYNRGAVFAQKVDVPVGDYNLGDFRLWVNADKEEVIRFDTLNFEVFLQNNTDSSFTGKLIIALNHQKVAYDSILNLTLPPDSTIVLDYSNISPSLRAWNWRFGLYESDQHEYKKDLKDAIARNYKGTRVIKEPFSLVLSRDKARYITGVDTLRYKVEIKNNSQSACSTYVEVYTLFDSVKCDLFSDTFELAGRERKEIEGDFFPLDYGLTIGRGELFCDLFFRDSIWNTETATFKLTYPDIQCALSLQDSFNYGVSNPYTVTLSSEENYIPSGKLFVEGNTFLDSIIIEGTSRADTTFSFDYNPDVWEIPGKLKVQYKYGRQEINKSEELPFRSPQISSFRPGYPAHRKGFIPEDTAVFNAQLALKGGLYGVPLEFCLWSDYLGADTLIDSIILDPCSHKNINLKTYADMSVPADTPIAYSYLIKYLNKEHTNKEELYYTVLSPEAVLHWPAGDTFSIGETIKIEYTNSIKAASVVDIQSISLYNNDVNESFSAPGEVTVPGEGSYIFPVTVSEWKKGQYYLEVQSKMVEGKGVNLNLYRNGCPVYIDGLEADIEVSTPQSYYGYGQEIPFSSLLENGGYGWTGTETLSVYRTETETGGASIWDIGEDIDMFGLIPDGSGGLVLDSVYSLRCITRGIGGGGGEVFSGSAQLSGYSGGASFSSDIDEWGNLWLSYNYMGRIEKINFRFWELLEAFNLPDSVGDIEGILTEKGIIYLIASDSGRVYKMNSTSGDIMGNIQPPNRRFLDLVGVTVKENGNVLAVERGTETLWEFSGSGDSVSTFELPFGLYYGDMEYKDGTVYISARDKILTIEGEVIDSFGFDLKDEYQWDNFGPISIGDDGKIAALGFGEAEHIILFSSDGEFESGTWAESPEDIDFYRGDIVSCGVRYENLVLNIYREFGKENGMLRVSSISEPPWDFLFHSHEGLDVSNSGSVTYEAPGPLWTPWNEKLVPLESFYGSHELPSIYINMEGDWTDSPVFNDCVLNIKSIYLVEPPIIENVYDLNLSPSDNVSFADTVMDTIPAGEYCVFGKAISAYPQEITYDWEPFTVIENNVTLLLEIDKEEGFAGDTFRINPLVINPLPLEQDSVFFMVGRASGDTCDILYIDTLISMEAGAVDSFPFTIIPEGPLTIRGYLHVPPSYFDGKEIAPIIKSDIMLSLDVNAPEIVDLSPFAINSEMYNYSSGELSLKVKRIFLTDTLRDSVSLETEGIYTFVDTFVTEEPGTLKVVVSSGGNTVIEEKFIDFGISGVVQLDSLYRVSPSSVQMSGIVNNAGLYPIEADALFCLVDGDAVMPADDMRLVADFESHGDAETQSSSFNPATTPDISHKDTENTKRNVLLQQNPKSQNLNPSLTIQPFNNLTADLSAKRIALSAVSRVGRNISLSEFISGLTRAGIDTSFFAVGLSPGEQDTVPIMFNEHAVGDYRLQGFLFTDSKSFMFDSASSPVNVVGDNQVVVDSLIVSEYCAPNGNVILAAIIENQSFGHFTGDISISSLACYVDSSIDMSGGSKDTVVFLIESVLDEGIYTFTSKISEGGNAVSEETQDLEFHPIYRFDSLPVGLTVSAPDSGEIEVLVTNIGNVKAERTLKVNLADVLNIDENINIEPASIDTFSGNFRIPEDFPGGEYFADASVFKNLFPEVDTFFNVNVNGLIVQATDSLNRPVYSVNDTALLSIFVYNKSLWSGELFAGLQYGELEVDTSFILGGMEKGVLNETLPRDTLYLDTSGIYMFDPINSESYDSVRISWNASLSDSFIFQMRTDSLIGREDWITVEKDSTYILDDWMQINFANKSTDTQWIDAICLYFNSLGCTKLDTFPLQREIVTFDVPVDSSEEKLGWGVYYPTGRSVVLDEKYVYLSDSMLTIFTDKGRYEMEDTVHATLLKHFPDTNYTFNYRVYFSPTEQILDSFKLTEDTSEFSFVVPDWTRSGTYSIDYWVKDTVSVIKDMHLTATFASHGDTKARSSSLSHTTSPDISHKDTKTTKKKDILLQQNPNPQIPNPNLTIQPFYNSTDFHRKSMPLAKQWVMGKPTLSAFGEGAFITGAHLFDVNGITIYFKNARMDTNLYHDGDIAEIRTEISSDIDCSVTLDISSTGSSVRDTLISLGSDIPNKFAFDYPIVGCRRGTNELYLHLARDSVSLAGFVIYFDVFLSDSIAPVISVLKRPANTYASNRYYELLARIYNLDETGTPFHDTLYYRAASSGGSSWHPLAAHSSRGDTNKYLIPSHPNGTHIEYMLVAGDEFGNRTCYPEEGTGDFWVLSPLKPGWEELFYTYAPVAELSWNSPEEVVYYHCGLSSDTVDIHEAEVATRFTSQYTPAQLQRIGLEIINENPGQDTLKVSVYPLGTDLLPGEKMDSFVFTNTMDGYTEFNLSGVDIPEIGIFTGISGSAGIKVILDGYGEGTHTAMKTGDVWGLNTSGEMLIDGMVSHLLPSASSIGGPSEILSYDIFRTTDPDNWTNIASGITNNNYTDTLIEENYEYYYKIMVSFGDPLDSFFSRAQSMFVDITAPTLDTIIIEDGGEDKLFISAILRDTSGIAWDSLGYKRDDTVRLISEDSIKNDEHFFSLSFNEDTFKYFLKAQDSSLIGNYGRYPASGFYETVLSSSGIRELLPDSTYLNRMLNVLVKQDIQIRYALDKEKHVNICMFDITGRRVETLVNEKQKAGYYSVPLNSYNLPRGIYFLRMTSEDYSKTTKLVKVR